MRRLRTKQLSSSEARSVLRGVGAGAEIVDAVIADFEERGYLDDASLAEHLVTSGSQRKGQGRSAIGRTLVQRGIPQEVADAALSALGDDDEERAREYAQAKAASLQRFDHDTALRRLAGQLLRRGYPESVSMSAARFALRAARRGPGEGFGNRAHGVRFEEAD